MAADAVAPSVRDRLALALDVDDVVAAQRLALQLRPWFGTVKIGLELFSAAGPAVVQTMIDDGYRVFLDLKLADIPTTVEKASRVLGALGVSYLTMHAFAGTPMLRAGVEGLSEGAARAGLETPRALAVTILTSDADAPPHILGKRVAVASEARCAGVVCAAGDVREAKSLAPNLLAVVPGIRPVGVPSDDQSRAATPEQAFAAGADLLVVGRAVTAAPDREAAAVALTAEMAAAGA
ncbi:orotidine-5'-phosphate decarboxylase [Acidiferrimicrobium sp. IK]|uniref:orotidine-5'-phosphate decarboxylase n=1 Tax=Acidiferrimicrobium sp. IK TaxID=2871700 RepID=UPI0021CAE77C|nr:orotidine-5'-phosphate decarboxylase [Acidiferrimicrobium sp. IK]MCU4184803.1 orotidine-5'-phosphate decarboxylase [Acidiferrimicrobium sp. IK]